MGTTPLFGKNEDKVGPRFVDLTQAYDRSMGQTLKETAISLGFHLREGVYAAMLGPNYETPAEVRMLRTLGADAVGMSTVPEVLALRHLGAHVAALSCITNLAAGISGEPLSHDEVKATAAATADRFVALLEAAAPALARMAT
jgi:purine-nucleoside phosphorylase